MVSQTYKFNLDVLQQQQSGDWATINENNFILEALLASPDYTETDAPASPSNGDLYIAKGRRMTITSTDVSADRVIVSGDYSSNLSADDAIEIINTTHNDGDFTIESVTYNAGTGNTEIITNESMDGSDESSPANGRVLHADGDWNGYHNQIAYYYEDEWHFIDPPEGAVVHIIASDDSEVYVRMFVKGDYYEWVLLDTLTVPAVT